MKRYFVLLCQFVISRLNPLWHSTSLLLYCFCMRLPETHLLGFQAVLRISLPTGFSVTCYVSMLRLWQATRFQKQTYLGPSELKHENFEKH